MTIAFASNAIRFLEVTGDWSEEGAQLLFRAYHADLAFKSRARAPDLRPASLLTAALRRAATQAGNLARSGVSVMNAREDNVAELIREAAAIDEQQKLRRKQIQWAKQWHAGHQRCPDCDGVDFASVETEYEGSLQYVTFRCMAETCDAFWKMELREAAVLILRDSNRDDDWIEIAIFDDPGCFRFDNRELATVLAALRCWQRRGIQGEYERDIATDLGRLSPLTNKEIDALCESLALR